MRAYTPETFLRSSLAPAFLFEKTDSFLSYYEGLSIQVRDPIRGLLVSDWIYESPSERTRLTLRINEDVGGSILTAHFVLQTTEDGQFWQEEPTDGGREAELLAAMKKHLQK